MIPWLLYGLTPRDQAGPLMRLVHDQLFQTANQAQFDWTIEIPNDNILMLTHVTLWGLTTGSTVSSGQVVLTDGTDPHFQSIKTPLRNSNLTNLFGSLSWDGAPIVMAPGHLDLVLTWNFAAAHVSNNVTMTYSGILIPRGTFATE